MDKMKMHTPNIADENFQKLAALFPNAVTETITGYDEEGKPIIERAIDADVLHQEISGCVVEGREERYQFTWPDKKKAMLAANAPIAATLRPVRGDSVGRDGTPGGWDSENLYIEGDNLDVLKLLQETYLGKVKLIYIDPPYNTGGDFVYDDDFAEEADEYLARSGQYDAQGNRLGQNLESNGRFHTDWLNMMYSRLKLAKNLLSDDGMIFISIGDEEVDNLRKIADEIFGESNFRNQITIRRGAKSLQAQFSTWDRLGQGVEYILFYTKSCDYRFPKQMRDLPDKRPGGWNNHWRGTDRPTMRYEIFGITPSSGQWRWSKERSYEAISNYQRMLSELGYPNDGNPSQEEIDKWYSKQPEGCDMLRLSTSGKPEHYIPPTSQTLLNNSWIDLLVGSSSEINQLFDSQVFDTAKLTATIMRIIQFADSDAIVLDFFSGSATTAHAVMKMNAEDGGHRRFIMVQLPEQTDESSAAFKAGYSNICEIGKERIRRAGRKTKDEAGLTAQNLDIGFRVLRLDSSNMQDVYYNPTAMTQDLLSVTTDNIKPDRSPEDLLFQVMLDLGVELSSPITETTIGGKKVYDVADGFLLACFDTGVTTETVTAIAKKQPFYAVFRDSSMADDSTATNFDQIFETYSHNTVRKVL